MMICVDDARSVAVRSPQSFEQWIVDGHLLGWPTFDDLAYHVTTLFPPVRPRGWLELRMIDALPEEWWPVAVAITTALLDDPLAAEWATSAVASVRDRWSTAAREALHDPTLGEAARWCFDAALLALERVGADPTTIDAAEEYAERFVRRYRCPADDLLDDWAGHPANV
jgi:glutamate--cysteine ligase